MVCSKDLETAAEMLDLPIDLLQSFVELVHSAKKGIDYSGKYQELTSALEAEYEKL